MLPDTWVNGQADLSVPGSTLGPASIGRASGGHRAGIGRASCEHGRVLRELRGRHGGPHLGTRTLAMVLVLLLASPLTVVVWRVLRVVLGTVL